MDYIFFFVFFEKYRGEACIYRTLVELISLCISCLITVTFIYNLLSKIFVSDQFIHIYFSGSNKLTLC